MPLLVTGAEVLQDSSAIVRYADRYSSALRLFPARTADHQEASEMERYFDRQLGPHSRRWAYFQLLGRVRLLNRLASKGVPRAERMMTSAIMAVTRPLIRRGYRVDPAGAEYSLCRVREVFKTVDDRLADGREYLVANTLSVADITFAALAAPMLLPARYGGAVPGESEVPGEMRAECTRLRSSRAGQFAFRVYERHR